MIINNMWILIVFAFLSTVTGQTVLPCSSTPWTFPSTTSTAKLTGSWTVPGFSCAYTINGRTGYNIEINCDPVQFNSAVDPCPNNFFKVNAQQNCNPPKVFYRFTQQPTLTVSVVAPSATGQYTCYLNLEPNMCACGKKRVGVDQYASAVLLKDTSSATFCGGSIVTPRDVITAASCVDSYLANQITVAAGVTTDYAEYNVISIQLHENYDPTTGRFDMAILRTATAIQLNANVGVACMPIRITDYAPSVVTLPLSQVLDNTYLNAVTALDRTVAPCNGASNVCTTSATDAACGFLKGSAITWPNIATDFVIGITNKLNCDATSKLTGWNTPILFSQNIDWFMRNIIPSSEVCSLPFTLPG